MSNYKKLSNITKPKESESDVSMSSDHDPTSDVPLETLIFDQAKRE